MDLYRDIRLNLPQGDIREVVIGLHWTAVVVEADHGLACGMASTLSSRHSHSGEPAIPSAGELESISPAVLAEWIEADVPLRRSVGCALINALLPPRPSSWVDENAEETILRHGAGRKVVLVGHFPFVPALKETLEDFQVIELTPRGDDLPASAAAGIIPEADVVAITGMTFINHTLLDLLALCRQDALVMLLGPTTPLSPVFSRYGIHMLAGSVVEDIPRVVRAIKQGGNFRQIHRAGVRLVLQQLDGDDRKEGRP